MSIGNSPTSEIIFTTTSNPSDVGNSNISGCVGLNSFSCGVSNMGFCTPSKGLAMTLNSNGFLGIGNSNPSYPLHITTTANLTLSNYGYYNNSGSGGSYSGSATTNFSMFASARIVVNGEVDVISDIRKKTNI